MSARKYFPQREQRCWETVSLISRGRSETGSPTSWSARDCLRLRQALCPQVGAGELPVVAAAPHDLRTGQVLDTDNSLCRVGQVLSGSGHLSILPGWGLAQPELSATRTADFREFLFLCYSLGFSCLDAPRTV